MKLVAEVTEFIAAHPQYACWAIFFLALSEAIPIVGTVVPRFDARRRQSDGRGFAPMSPRPSPTSPIRGVWRA